MVSLESKFFCLKNKRLNCLLNHPGSNTPRVMDRKCAEDMLVACHEYLDASGRGNIKVDFVIEEANAEVYSMQQTQS